MKSYAKEAGALAKVCESWDHLENLSFREMMQKSNLALLKLVLAEAALRQLNLEALYHARLSVLETRSIFNGALRNAKPSE